MLFRSSRNTIDMICAILNSKGSDRILTHALKAIDSIFISNKGFVLQPSEGKNNYCEGLLPCILLYNIISRILIFVDKDSKNKLISKQCMLFSAINSCFNGEQLPKTGKNSKDIDFITQSLAVLFGACNKDIGIISLESAYKTFVASGDYIKHNSELGIEIIWYLFALYKVGENWRANSILKSLLRNTNFIIANHNTHIL